MQTSKNIRVFMITSEWPTLGNPSHVPFIVRQVESLKKASVDITVFHFRGKANPFRYLLAWILVQKRLHRENYDLIHAQWGQSGLLAFPRKIPLVVTFRGSD